MKNKKIKDGLAVVGFGALILFGGFAIFPWIIGRLLLVGIGLYFITKAIKYMEEK